MSDEYPDNTRSVLMTDCCEDGDDFLVFTTLEAKELETVMRARNFRPFSECYEIQPHEHSLYCIGETNMLTVKEEAFARKVLEEINGQAAIA